MFFRINLFFFMVHKLIKKIAFFPFMASTSALAFDICVKTQGFGILRPLGRVF